MAIRFFFGIVDKLPDIMPYGKRIPLSTTTCDTRGVTSTLPKWERACGAKVGYGLPVCSLTR